MDRTKVSGATTATDGRHTTLSAYFGAMWGEIVAMSYSEHCTDIEITNAGAAASHGRGGSTMSGGGSEANGARKAPGAAVTSSCGRGSCRRNGGRVVGRRPDPGLGPTSRNFFDGI